MKIYDAPTLAAAAVAPKGGGPATVLLHDCGDARVVLFRINPGQVVPVHTSSSTVLLTIMSGTGTVIGEDGERTVKPGDIVAYTEHEPHGMQAADEQLTIAAVIAPRPGRH
ncbi:MAG: cupin domain-containing protein [Gemmatimonadaceae bacterium]